MKHGFQRSAFVTAICTGFASFSPVWAQALVGEQPPHLDEVTITARSLENSPLFPPAQQLSGAALTQRLGSTLGETLDKLPGIANSSFGPNVGRPVIRGMEGEHVRILQNGGASLDVSGLSNDHAVPMDPLTTERVEVLRGPATLLYGGSAMGGVVNVIDNRIARERAFEAQGGVMGKAEIRAGGASGERSTGAMVEAGTDKLALHVDAFDRSTQNLQVPKEMRCDGTPNGRRVCNSASDSQGGAVGGTLLFDRGYLGMSTSEYRSTYGTVAEPNVRIGMVRRHDVVEGQLRDIGGLIQSLKFQLGHTRYTHTEFDIGVAGTRFDNQGHDFRLEAHQLALPVGPDMQLKGLMGLQRDRNNLQGRDPTGAVAFLPPSRTQSSGVFTYQALKTAWGQLSAAARAEEIEIASTETIGPNDAQTKKFKPLSIALGALRDLREGETQDGWQFTSNWRASQRAPKDYELFAYGEHAATGTFEIGQPSLGLEKGTQFELGSEWKNGLHKWGITGFTSNFSNYIALQPTGVTTNGPNGWPTYQFAGVRARFYGIESTAKIRLVGGQQAVLSPVATHGALDLELLGGAVRAQDLTHNAPLPRIAPMRLGADAAWSRNAWGARFGFMHAAAQQRVPDNGANPGVMTDSHTLWHATLNFHTHSGPTHWLLFAKLDNLTNKLAYSSTSVLTQTMGANAPPLAGRHLKLGAQVSF